MLLDKHFDAELNKKNDKKQLNLWVAWCQRSKQIKFIFLWKEIKESQMVWRFIWFLIIIGVLLALMMINTLNKDLYLLAWLIDGKATIRCTHDWLSPTYPPHITVIPRRQFQIVCRVVKSKSVLRNWQISISMLHTNNGLVTYLYINNLLPSVARFITSATPPTFVTEITKTEINEPNITVAWITSVQTTALIPPCKFSYRGTMKM